MQRDWFLGLAAFSTLATLVAIDMLVCTAIERGRLATNAIARRVRQRP